MDTLEALFGLTPTGIIYNGVSEGLSGLAGLYTGGDEAAPSSAAPKPAGDPLGVRAAAAEAGGAVRGAIEEAGTTVRTYLLVGGAVLVTVVVGGVFLLTSKAGGDVLKTIGKAF